MTRKVQNGPEREDRPPLERLGGGEDDRAGDAERPRRRAPHRAFGEHRQERRRDTTTLHQRIDVAGRLDAAARALGALVARRAARLDEHRDEDDDGNSDRHDLPTRRPPSPLANLRPG